MDDAISDSNDVVHVYSQLVASSFNADGTCVCLSTKYNFSVMNTSPAVKRFDTASLGGLRVLELHYSSSLIACVPSGDRAELAFPSTIIKCQMNKDHIVVALDEQVFIYDIWSLALIKSLSCGKGGCISLCTGNLSYLAVPHHLTTGLIHIYNCGKDDIENLFSNGISAHKTKITHCQISTSGKYIATASTTGTIVRLFSLTSGDIVGSFRRGFHHALVTSISFCIKDEFVAVGSSSGTVHIFTINSLFIGNDSKSLESSLPESENKLNNQTDQVSSSSESKSVIPVSPVNFFQSALGTISNNVAVFASEVARQSKELRDAMDPVRAEYLIRIPGGESQFKTTILQEHYDSSTGSYPTIYIVTDGGFLYRFRVPTELSKRRKSETENNLSNITESILCIQEEEYNLLDL